MAKPLKSNAPLTARIKKLMQSDEDVGKVAKASPVLIAKALDIFLHKLVQGAVQVAEKRGARTLTSAHLKEHVNSDPLLDFIKETVASAPDLPPQGATDNLISPPKLKRPRASLDESESGTPRAAIRGRGRGRGSGGGRGRGRGRRRLEAQEQAAGAGELGAREEQTEQSAQGQSAQQHEGDRTIHVNRVEQAALTAVCTDQPQLLCATHQHPDVDHTAAACSTQDSHLRVSGNSDAQDCQVDTAHHEMHRGSGVSQSGTEVPQVEYLERSAGEELGGEFCNAAPEVSHLPTAFAPAHTAQSVELPEEEDYDAE